VIFWDVTPCKLVGTIRFSKVPGHDIASLTVALNTEAANTSDAFSPFYPTTRRHFLEDKFHRNEVVKIKIVRD
jgi:hypothetical protein